MRERIRRLGGSTLRPAALRSTVGQLCAKFRHPLAALCDTTETILRVRVETSHLAGHERKSLSFDAEGTTFEIQILHTVAQGSPCQTGCVSVTRIRSMPVK